MFAFLNKKNVSVTEQVKELVYVWYQIDEYCRNSGNQRH